MICIGIHTVAIIRASEDYETISEGFKDFFQSINDLVNNPLITVDGVQYELKLFFCCDYKVSCSIAAYAWYIIINYVHIKYT